MNGLLDCCCGSPAPVNIVGAPGQSGLPGAPGALVLLGQLFADFHTAQTQAIPINAIAYIIKEVIFAPSEDLLASVGGIYVTNGSVGQIITPYTFAGSFAAGTWRTMALGAVAVSGQAVLTGSEIYLITTVGAALDPASGYVNVYGYVLA